MKVLITAGATREPLDSVRFITNFSTGQTGAELADFLVECGHEVTVLMGAGSVLPRHLASMDSYETFEDLNQLLKDHLAQGEFDTVIHAAAVSDYSVKEILTSDSAHPSKKGSKLNSNQELKIVLKPNFKIVERLKSYSPDPIAVVAFKLTATDSEKEKKTAIEKLSLNPQIDLVVHNDLMEMKSEKNHSFWIYRRSEKIASCPSRVALAQSLEQILRSAL